MPGTRTVFGERVGGGRERFAINLRYPRALRGSPEAMVANRAATPCRRSGALGALAKLSIADGPAKIKSENGP
ncbi:MAG: hypothetical protein ACYCY1_16210 [Sulfuriferula sp.]